MCNRMKINNFVYIIIFKYLLLILLLLTLYQKHIYGQNENNYYSDKIIRLTESIKTTNKKETLLQLYTQRGFCYFMQNNYINAIKDYNQAIKINPKYYDSYALKARVYLKEKKYNKALKLFNYVNKKDPYFDIFLYRGLTYVALKKYQKALIDYNKAVTSDYNEAYKQRAKLYIIFKEYDKALQDIENAKKNTPSVNTNDLEELDEMSKEIQKLKSNN